MKSCAFYGLILFLIACALPGHAQPLYGMVLAKPVASTAASSGGVLHSVHWHECGWDYPCPPPHPVHPRHHYLPKGLSIHNNYGTVNVYVNRHGEIVPPPPPAAPAASLPCCDGQVREEARAEGEVKCDRSGPCDSDCGPGCWYDRFKQGYCGHGCEVYREKVRFEKVERKYEAPRPVYYRSEPSPRPAAVEYPDEDATPYERPPVEERRRFEGPPYSRCPNGGC